VHAKKVGVQEHKMKQEMIYTVLYADAILFAREMDNSILLLDSQDFFKIFVVQIVMFEWR